MQAAQLLAIIVGGAWFLFQYRENVRDGQREQALKYATRAYESDLVRDLAVMQTPSQNSNFGPQLRDALRTSYSRKDICPIRVFYIESLIPLYYSTESERREFFRSLNGLLIFYKSLSVCVDSGACDLKTACDFFFRDAKALLGRHCTYFDQVKISTGSSPAEDIRDFLHQCTPRYKTLTPCEDIESVSGKNIEILYQSCSKTASTN